jgi:tetratricopeptide (TPR) repeat protein
MTDSGADLFRRAREAAAEGDWKSAHDLLGDADASGLLPEADLPWRAQVAYAAGHLDVAIEAWERAHAASVRGGDDLAAAGAAVRVAMHLLFDTALMAPVRGWLSRAERLIQGREPTAVHAWLAVVRGYERLLSGDVGAASEWARQAVDIGTRFDPAAAAIGQVAEARCLILGGKVREGLKALDEAGVAMLTGEIDPLSTGVVYCEVVCALQALAQYDLAEQWTRAMERWARVSAIGSLHGRCRVHRAEILRLRGSCAEAEEEAFGACEELRPYLRRELGWPLTELGRIRQRRGDLDGAEEAFLAAHECGWDPQPGLALVHLARGDVEAAATAIRAALAHPSTVPSKELPPNTDLQRAPLLDAAVEIEVAVGDLQGARRAADELSQIAATFESKALIASATRARARVQLAEGHPVDARTTFEQAVRLWNAIEAPYETALARLGLAEAQRAAGDEQLADVELRAARATLARLGAESHAERAPAPRAEPQPGVSAEAFRCEGDTWWLAFAGRSVRLRDLKGLHYLARLLAEPGREFHVLELVGLEREPPEPGRGPRVHELRVSTGGDAGPLLDARAKEAYRRRLTEIDEDIAEATSMADLGRIAQAHAEREFLVRELSRAVGLGGRDRRAGSASERARVSVTRAVRQALARIREHHVPLADHLERVVRTGTYCAYLPDPRVRVTWTF